MSLFCVSCSGFHVDSALAAETVLIATIVSTANMESPTPRPGNAYATTANVYILYVRSADLNLRYPGTKFNSSFFILWATLDICFVFFHVDHQNSASDPPQLPEPCSDSLQTLNDSTGLPDVKVGVMHVCLTFHRLGLCFISLFVHNHFLISWWFLCKL